MTPPPNENSATPPLPQKTNASHKFLTLSLILIVCVAATFFLFQLFHQNPRGSDGAVLNEMHQEVVRLWEQSAQTNDPQKQAELARQALQKVQESGEKLSPEMRKQQQTIMALMAPFQQQAGIHEQKAVALSKIEGGWLSAFSKSPQSLANGRAQIKELTDANKSMLNAYNALLEETDRRLKTNDTSSSINLNMLAGFRATFGNHASFIRQIVGMNAEMYGDIDKILELLQDNPTQWERSNNDGSLLYKDAALQGQIQPLLTDIYRLAEQQKAVRQQALSTR